MDFKEITGSDIAGTATEKLTAILAKALGLFVKPTERLLLAKTDLYIDRLKKKNEYELKKIDIAERAKLREYETSVRRQCNLEKISNYTIHLLDGTEKPENLDIDWLHNFATNAQDVSEETIQIILAKILAEEAKTQGSYSRKTLEILKNMNKKDLIMFQKLMEISVFDKQSGWIFNKTIEKLTDLQNIKFFNIVHLENMGLTNYNENFMINFKPSNRWYCHNNLSKFIIANNTKETISIGITLLTESANELSLAISNIKKTVPKEISEIFYTSDTSKLKSIYEIILDYLKSKGFNIYDDSFHDDEEMSFLQMIMS